ncbi:DEAD/DEAH box helicase [Epilithonimonas vandammei]|uniref:DEAD/DEAH box helicase n=1 Tax=Epilithonimonas vandammei TaxID=2487072 RepID=UPI0028B09CF7|nr:DEAD/DEAH box helicase [Epilithonimonas vandammei]
MQLIERLEKDIFSSDYYHLLFNKCILISSYRNLKFQQKHQLFTDKEFIDTLRFADILSNSETANGRNQAYYIVTSLNNSYFNHPTYKTVSKAVFSKLGNFPAINYLENKNNNNAEIPYDFAIEEDAKKIFQKVPDSENLFFTDSQYELFTKLSNSIEFSFSGPTSMGKSFIIKSFIKKVIKNSPPENIVILVPTRALINQFSIDLKTELVELFERYNYKVLVNSNITDIVLEENYSYVFVLTPERLLSYLSQENTPPIGFLFVDEAHKLGNFDDARSVTLYTSIEKTQKKYKGVKLYFSSPNVANPEVFLKLFNRKSKNSFFYTDESPVSQNLYFVDIISKNIKQYYAGTEINLEIPESLSSINNDIDFIKRIGDNQNNLIYCNYKNKTVEKANQFIEQKTDFVPNKEVMKAVKNISEYIHPDYYLTNLLKKGVAYHHGKLPQAVRNIVEDLYKKEYIRNVFCTSTLLEGVNMPTQNIFILDNRNYRKEFNTIDFWNLSGRAGRLTKELEGNIYCIQYDNSWDNKEIFKKEKIELTPTIYSKVDKNLQKIESIINGKNISGTQLEKEILQYIANIIKIDSLETDSNYKSPIINKLIEKNKDKIIELAKTKTEHFQIPRFILSNNQNIDFDIQNQVFSKLSLNSKDIQLPSSGINYETCLEILNNMYSLYRWDFAEKKLRDKNSLKYYAVLMNQWINGLTLSQIIKESIDWRARKENSTIKISFNEYIPFDKTNKKHINILIEEIIDDIEYVLRFLFEKYFNHYYQIVLKIKGEEKSGENWATLLEYGTQNRIVIALQNLGLSRNTSIKIYQNHRDSLIMFDNKLHSINKTKLLSAFNSNSIEYDEIRKIL